VDYLSFGHAATGSPSTSLPLKLLDSALAMAFDHEQEIRRLIQLIVSERDPDVLRVLASELERLLGSKEQHKTAYSCTAH
jgi:hypothetical protein